MSDLRAGTDNTIALLNEVAEFLEGQADVRDGSYGEQVPNRAMSLMAEVELTIERLKRDSRLGPVEQDRVTRSETASRNAAPQEGAGSPAGPAANGELAVAAFINDLPIPEEFHALASFYDVKDLSSLVRMQQEHIEGLQAKLPPTPTFPGPQRVREG
jgi:hypothetical protein